MKAEIARGYICLQFRESDRSGQVLAYMPPRVVSSFDSAVSCFGFSSILTSEDSSRDVEKGHAPARLG